MIYAYIGRNRKLCLRPADPEGEHELEEFFRNLKQLGLEAIDIETQMPDEEFHNHQQNRQRYGYEQRGHGFGFNSPQARYPQPPDFNPQSHFPFPLVFPIYFGNGSGSGGGSGGGSGSGGSTGYRDNVVRAGEYDGRENPRDTGGRDIPRR